MKKERAEVAGDGCFLPDGIVEDILSRLHSKTLLRMMIVCKKWKSWISSCYFKRLHDEKSSKTPNLLLLSGSPIVGYVLVTLSLTGEELDRWNIPLASKINMLPSPCGPKNLLCLVVDSNQFMLCIPSVRKIIRILPEPYSPLNTFSAYGFCYLPDRNQHVIVCFGDTDGWQVATYSDDNPYFLRWKPVVGGTEVRISGSRWGTFANGFLYWVGCDLIWSPSLLCFDLYEEKFSMVSLGDQIRDAYSFFIVELKGDLHLMTTVWRTYTLWKLDVADQTWMKLHTLGHPRWYFSKIIGCHDGAMLLRGEHFLMWLSPQNKVKFRAKRLPIFQYPLLINLKLHADILSS